MMGNDNVSAFVSTLLLPAIDLKVLDLKIKVVIRDLFKNITNYPTGQFSNYTMWTYGRRWEGHNLTLCHTFF